MQGTVHAAPFVPGGGGMGGAGGATTLPASVNVNAAPFVPGGAGGGGKKATPPMGAGAPVFVPRNARAPAFVPGGNVDAAAFAPKAQPPAQAEDLSFALPDVGDLEIFGMTENPTNMPAELNKEFRLNMAAQQAVAARMPPAAVEMHGGALHAVEAVRAGAAGAGGRRAHARHRPLPESFRPSVAPGQAHLASRFMPEDLRAELQHKAFLEAAQEDIVNSANMPELPEMIGAYHSPVYLEEKPQGSEELPSAAFGVRTTLVKAVSRAEGAARALRRVDHRQLLPTGAMVQHAKSVVHRWGRVAHHPAVVKLHSVFVSREMGDAPALFFAHDYLPAAITLQSAHMRSHQGGPMVGAVVEEAMWSYAIQIVSALRVVHAAGLVCRAGCLAPSKVLLTGRGRLALGACGVLDVIGPTIPAGMATAQAQAGDISAAGHLLLLLACGGVAAPSLELCSMHYSPELCGLVRAMLEAGSPGGVQDCRQLSGLLADHMWVEMDSVRAFGDALQKDLAMELENGRLFRLMVKLGMITERAELELDASWAETGDRYLLKLFRDWVFHRHTDTGAPSVDWGFVVEALNKLDAGVPEKILLMSRDEMSMLVVSYREIKRCLETVYNELSSRAVLDARRAEGKQLFLGNVPMMHRR